MTDTAALIAEIDAWLKHCRESPDWESWPDSTYNTMQRTRDSLAYQQDVGLQLLEIAAECARHGRIIGNGERVPDVVREMLSRRPA